MQHVEEAVHPQEQHDVRRDVLDVLRLCYHVQLRQDRHCLQPDRIGPQHTVESEVSVEEERQHQCSQVEGPVGEGV